MLAGIPWVGRDKQVRDRMVDLAMQYVLYEEGREGVDIKSLSDEEKKRVLEEAKRMVVKQERATGFLGFIAPAIPYFQNREQEDIRPPAPPTGTTYRDWLTPQEDQGTLSPGARDKARTAAQKEQRALRAKYKEYEPFFDYIDGIVIGDDEKVIEVGGAHPEVIAYFVGLYNNLGGEFVDDMGVQSFDDQSWESWAAASAVGMRPPKLPGALIGR
jgi:hypothetical protein